MNTKIIVIIQDGETFVRCTDKGAQISIVNFDQGDSIPPNFFPHKPND